MAYGLASGCGSAIAVAFTDGDSAGKGSMPTVWTSEETEVTTHVGVAVFLHT